MTGLIILWKREEKIEPALWFVAQEHLVSERWLLDLDKTFNAEYKMEKYSVLGEAKLLGLEAMPHHYNNKTYDHSLHTFFTAAQWQYEQPMLPSPPTETLLCPDKPIVLSSPW